MRSFLWFIVVVQYVWFLLDGRSGHLLLAGGITILLVINQKRPRE